MRIFNSADSQRNRMTTKLHNIVMIVGIVASGLTAIITALIAGGFNLGTGIVSVMAVLTFLSHIADGNTPANTPTDTPTVS